MDLNKTIQEAVDKTIAEKLPEIIEGKVVKLVDDILGDVFRSYSDTGKAIKTRIEQHLDVNLQKFDMIDYNGIISTIIQEHLVKCVNAGTIAPITKLVEETLGFVASKDMTLTELVDKVKAIAMEEDSSESEGEITCIVATDDDHKWHKIFLDLDADKSKENCSVRFIVSFAEKNTDNHIFALSQTSRWRSFRESVTPFRLAQYDRLQHEIFRLYAARINFTVDDTTPCVEWTRYED